METHPDSNPDQNETPAVAPEIVWSLGKMGTSIAEDLVVGCAD